MAVLGLGDQQASLYGMGAENPAIRKSRSEPVHSLSASPATSW
jgi:hypothetical protein